MTGVTESCVWGNIRKQYGPQVRAFARATAPEADAVDPSPAPDLGDEARALQSLGFSKSLIQTLSSKARQNGTTIERELLHHPGIE